MGCGKSTQTHSVDDENDLVITRDGQVNGNKTELVKIEGIETTENSSQDSGQNGYRPPARKPAIQKNWQTRSIKSQSGREIENAWGVSKAKTKIIEDVTEKPKGQMLRDMDFKSEYGRDGVDISSTFVGNDATDKLVHASLVKRTPPDGTQFTKYSEVTKNPRALHKAESEEEFDPSALIDIAKFKAANAPSKQPTKASNDSEAPEEGNNDPTNAAKINPREVKIVTMPSNYNEFYDDDEKQLIESIENDFNSISLPVLPGSVI